MPTVAQFLGLTKDERREYLLTEICADFGLTRDEITADEDWTDEGLVFIDTNWATYGVPMYFRCEDFYIVWYPPPYPLVCSAYDRDEDTLLNIDARQAVINAINHMRNIRHVARLEAELAFCKANSIGPILPQPITEAIVEHLLIGDKT